jgi:plastocyanin
LASAFSVTKFTIWRGEVARLSLFAILGALAVAGVAWAGTQFVDQKNLRFSVSLLKISADDVVVFKNSDDVVHDITITGEGLLANSGLQHPGDDFKVRLVKPGTYKVTCGIHPRMKLTVIVE